MRLHLCRTIAAAALIVLSGAAFADVTVSQSNDPTTLIGEQFASLFEAEHDTVNALPEPAAVGCWPMARCRSGTKTASASPTAIEYTDAWLGRPAGTDWRCAMGMPASGAVLRGARRIAARSVCGGRGDPEPGRQPGLSRHGLQVVQCQRAAGLRLFLRLRRLRSMHEAVSPRSGRPDCAGDAGRRAAP